LAVIGATSVGQGQRTKVAFLNFGWVKPWGLICRGVQFSGDEEEDCFHGLEAGVTARFSFGGFIDAALLIGH
jgi:hypothetical protein